MKKIVCVFAHPDDEAFGPAGTIAQFAQENEVYILCATRGQAGKDSDSAEDLLSKRRAKELLKSAKILGVKKVYFLGFRDGRLCNNIYHKLAEKIEEILQKIQPDMILTFDQKGVSGHIDHITVSLVTTFVFEKLSFIKELWYYCQEEKRRNRFAYDYYIYFPHGYKRAEIDKIMNIEDVWETKAQAMMCHKSQKHDAERILERTKDLPKEEYFLVTKK